MADLCARFGGVTTAAWNAITPETGSPPEGVVRLSLYPQDDSRYGYAILDTLGEAFASIDQYYRGRDTVLRLLSFYWPLFTSFGFHFDDSGGRKQAVGPVLAPQRCRHLLDCWVSVDTQAMEELLNHYPLFFDPAQRPHAKFENARQFLDVLGCYATFLEQAIERDSFYFSFDGNCL